MTSGVLDQLRDAFQEGARLPRSGMEYRILKSSDADKRHFRVLL